MGVASRTQTTPSHPWKAWGLEQPGKPLGHLHALVRLPPLWGPPLRCLPGSRLLPPEPLPLNGSQLRGEAQGSGPRCSAREQAREWAGQRDFCVEPQGPCHTPACAQTDKGLPCRTPREGCPGPALPRPGFPCPSHLYLGTCGPCPPMDMGLWWVPAGTGVVLEGDDLALLWALCLGGGEGGSRIRKSGRSGKVRPGARDPDVTAQPRGSQPRAALTTAGGSWEDRPLETLPTFPRKVSGYCGGGRGDF